MEENARGNNGSHYATAYARNRYYGREQRETLHRARRPPPADNRERDMRAAISNCRWRAGSNTHTPPGAA